MVPADPIRYLSRARHVEAGSNLRGPSRKAKYSPATDSVPSSASERWEEPPPGEDSEPETTCLQAVGARLPGARNQGPGVRGQEPAASHGCLVSPASSTLTPVSCPLG